MLSPGLPSEYVNRGHARITEVYGRRTSGVLLLVLGVLNPAGSSWTQDADAAILISGAGQVVLRELTSH
jgi:hypothetical protein